MTTGTCLCGASRLRFQGEPEFAIHCYCTDCQKISGGAGAVQVAVAADGFEVDGPVNCWTSVADSGAALEFSFCGRCGTPLFKKSATLEGRIFVYAAAVDDPTLIPSLRPVFEERKPAWVGLA